MITSNSTETGNIGPCPRCGGSVILEDGRYCCKKRLEGNCDFEIRRDFFVSFGKPTISIEGMRRLLNSERIQIPGLMSPVTGEVFDSLIHLQWMPQHGKWDINFVFKE